jgi:hypothetical protein
LDSVGITTDYGLDDRGLIPGKGRFFSSPQHPDWFWVPPNLIYNMFYSSFPEAKRLEFEADHSPPSSAEVKNAAAISALSICLYGVVFK